MTGISNPVSTLMIIDKPQRTKMVPITTSGQNSNLMLKTLKLWGERWGSNPRPSEPQPDALPTELLSP